jgi:putative addiction module component (TIGR02574 family)
MDTQQLLEEALSLPIDERTSLIDALLNSLNHPIEQAEEAGYQNAERRLNEINSGKVEIRAGEAVFAEAWKRLEK